MALVQKAFSEIITFSRSSNATRVGPTGLVEYAPHNLALQSQTFGTTWTQAFGVVTSNTVAAPDGTVTADTWAEDTSNSEHYLQQGFTSSASTPYTFSVYAKASARTKLRIQALSITSPYEGFYADADLSAGTIGSITAGNGGTGISASISSSGNGWYRVSIAGTIGAKTNLYVRIFLLNAAGSSSYTGDGTSGIYLWGAQLSVGPYPLDYTPTTSAAVYGPRFDYDPVTLAARGLLVEEQRTNLLVRSEQIDSVPWTQNEVSVTPNSVTAPDGQTAAETITSNAGTSYHAVWQNITISAGATHSFSVFLKKGSWQYAQLNFGSAGATNRWIQCIVNLDTGAILSSSAGAGGTLVSANISSFGNGWYRVTLTGSVSTDTSVYCYIAVVSSATPTLGNYGLEFGAGSASNNFYLWGAQLEAGSFATSYIPTLASTVTRSADVASVNTLSPFYNAVEGSLYGEFEVRGLTGGLVQINDGTNNYADSIIFGEFATGNSYGLRIFVSTTAQADFSTSDPAVGSIQKFAGGFKANDFGFTKNGASTSTDTSGSVPSGATTLKIGRAWTGNTANMWIRRLAFYPRKLSSAELQALTA